MRGLFLFLHKILQGIFDEVKTHVPSVTGHMNTVEALLGDDMNYMYEKSKLTSIQNRYIHSHPHSGKRDNAHQDSSSSGSDLSFSISTSRSSRDGHRGFCCGDVTHLSATYSSNGAIRAWEKGRLHLGFCKLKQIKKFSLQETVVVSLFFIRGLFVHQKLAKHRSSKESRTSYELGDAELKVDQESFHSSFWISWLACGYHCHLSNKACMLFNRYCQCASRAVSH